MPQHLCFPTSRIRSPTNHHHIDPISPSPSHASHDLRSRCSRYISFSFNELLLLTLTLLLHVLRHSRRGYLSFTYIYSTHVFLGKCLLDLFSSCFLDAKMLSCYPCYLSRRHHFCTYLRSPLSICHLSVRRSNIHSFDSFPSVWMAGVGSKVYQKEADCNLNMSDEHTHKLLITLPPPTSPPWHGLLARSVPIAYETRIFKLLTSS